MSSSTTSIDPKAGSGLVESIGLQAGAGSPPEGEARIARLFEMTSDLLATISLDGHFTLLNPAWEQLLGWTLEELQAQSMQEFVHPDDPAQTPALILDG